MASPAPKAPSSLVKVSRYSLLAAGIFYGKVRYDQLKKKEDERRAKEEAERPAKEAAMKAEKERKNQEEMVYLAQQAGVKGSGGGSRRDGGGGGGSSGGSPGGDRGECDPCKKEYRANCGCRF